MVLTIVVPTFHQALIVAFFPRLLASGIVPTIGTSAPPPKKKRNRQCVGVFFNFSITFITSLRHCVISSLLFICFYVRYLEI